MLPLKEACFLLKMNKKETFISDRLRNGQIAQLATCLFSLKGGDPAAPSDTATLLRLHPSHRSHLRRLPPFGQLTGFGCSQLPWCDGRCVQGPGTYSPRHADPRLLATPTSCGRVAAHNPNWDDFFGIRSSLRIRFPLWSPL